MSTQFKGEEHKRDWALWVLVGLDNNSVGLGLVCGRQLYHGSLKDDKDSSAWMSWGNLRSPPFPFAHERQWTETEQTPFVLG